MTNDLNSNKSNVLYIGIVTLILSAITLILGYTEIGLIPVPTSANSATILQIPAILASIICGWPSALIVSFSFGLISFLTSEIPLFQDVLVSILPRLFIGFGAYFAYLGGKKLNDYAAYIFAAAAGTLTNTILVLTMASIRGFMKAGTAFKVGLVHGIPEVIVAIIIVVLVMILYNFILGQIKRRKAE